ncbi:MAG: tRNA (guanosine(46)-N7)-methyltransferase TrmB [Nitrospinaceae bacterium]
MSSRPLISFEKIAEEHPYFLDSEDYPNWPEQFGNTHPLVFEIGFGNGNFLLDMAALHPTVNFIGMDFYHKGIRKLITRIDRHQFKNIRIVYGNAREKIPFLFREGEVHEVYINFPDPWPKKRHFKRRLIQPGFVSALASKIRPGGLLHAATDFEVYAMAILECLEGENSLKNRHPAPGFSINREDIPRSKYEKNFLQEGKTIYYFDFEKK